MVASSINIVIVVFVSRHMLDTGTGERLTTALPSLSVAKPDASNARRRTVVKQFSVMASPKAAAAAVAASVSSWHDSSKTWFYVEVFMSSACSASAGWAKA